MVMISLTALALASASPAVELLPATGVMAAAPRIDAEPVDQPPAATPSASTQPQADGAQPPAAGAPPPADSAPPQADSAPPADQAAPAVPSVDTLPSSLTFRDPWEKPNRAIWHFDVFFEKNLLGPVAHGYQAVAPQPVRNAISNVIYNLDEPSTFLNNLLQLKIGRAVKTTVRFAINSTLGVGGMFDVAAKGGLPQRPADFGQTLARWGAKPGPYVMLPFLGPSDVRDGFGRLFDTFTDPVGFVIGGIFTSPGGAARFTAAGVNWRQQNDGTMSAIYGASDSYAFARSAYAQRRASVVQDSTGKAQDLPDF